MLERVRERLLDDAVRRQVEAGRQRAGLPGYVDRHLEAGGLYLFHEVVELGEAGPSALRSLVVRDEQDVQEPAELGHAFTAHQLDRRERAHRGLDVSRQDALAGLGL